MVFGNSSAGEWFWDGACLLAGALLSFRLTRVFARCRWGVVAAVSTLAVFAVGPTQDLIGYGLGEISSAGLLSMAALCVLRSRHRRATAAVAAGLATLAFYTRLNILIMAAGTRCSRCRSTCPFVTWSVLARGGGAWRGARP